MNEQSFLLFKEVQRFRQKWLWYFLIGMFIVTFALVTYGTSIHLAQAPAYAKRPSNTGVLAAVGLAELITALVVLGLFAMTHLTTEVRADGLYIRFVPFHLSPRRIPFNTLKTYAVRTYSPLREYGGWGIRWGRSGRAYNVSGNRGVQLELVSGKRILIGSQMPEELANAIERASGRPGATDTGGQ